MSDDPIARFATWLAEAKATELNDPDAMALATVDATGRPSARMVLLKGVSEAGFVFYTNQQSRKAAAISANAFVALNFHWKSLRRQVRIEGTAAQVGNAEADAYFASRSRLSQLGAWASDQSRPMPNRATFEQRVTDMTARFERQDVPRPPHWSGYCVAPDRIEFWTDMPGRLHFREIYERENDVWRSGLLYP
jgi:pyridoxamine 5'-phosphate oxidase